MGLTARMIIIFAFAQIDSRAPPLLTRRRKCGRLRRLCRASWQEALVAVTVGAFVSPLSEHVSPEQPGGAPVADGHALNCNQWHVPGGRACIELQPGHVQAPAPLLGWDVESRC